MEKDIEEFLKYRKRFTKRQWFDLNQVVDARLNEKADQLELDDLDIQIVTERIKHFI